MNPLCLGVIYADAYSGVFSENHHMASYGGYGSVGHSLMFVFWLIFFGVFGYLIFQLSGRKNNDNDNAMNVLKERYAKGEIDKEEFEEKKKNLQ